MYVRRAACGGSSVKPAAGSRKVTALSRCAWRQHHHQRRRSALGMSSAAHRAACGGRALAASMAALSGSIEASRHRVRALAERVISASQRRWHFTRARILQASGAAAAWPNDSQHQRKKRRSSRYISAARRHHFVWRALVTRFALGTSISSRVAASRAALLRRENSLVTRGMRVASDIFEAGSDADSARGGVHRGIISISIAATASRAAAAWSGRQRITWRIGSGIARALSRVSVWRRLVRSRQAVASGSASAS